MDNIYTSCYTKIWILYERSDIELDNKGIRIAKTALCGLVIAAAALTLLLVVYSRTDRFFYAAGYVTGVTVLGLLILFLLNLLLRRNKKRWGIAAFALVFVLLVLFNLASQAEKSRASAEPTKKVLMMKWCS
jgi:hypothetical protein